MNYNRGIVCRDLATHPVQMEFALQAGLACCVVDVLSQDTHNGAAFARTALKLAGPL